jgi:hypothetical protein
MTFATITWELVGFHVHTTHCLLLLTISEFSSKAVEISAKFEIEVFPDGGHLKSYLAMCITLYSILLSTKKSNKDTQAQHYTKQQTTY